MLFAYPAAHTQSLPCGAASQRFELFFVFILYLQAQLIADYVYNKPVLVKSERNAKMKKLLLLAHLLNKKFRKIKNILSE